MAVMNTTLSTGRNLLWPWRLLAGTLLVAASLVVAGCGDSGTRYNVSGKATFDGKPIPVGRIYFDPDPKTNPKGLQGTAEIKDGQYDTAKSRKGPSGGAVTVRIEGADGVRVDDEHPNGKPLFPSYKTTAELPKETTTKDFDVPASAGKTTKPTTKPSGGRP